MRRARGSSWIQPILADSGFQEAADLRPGIGQVPLERHSEAMMAGTTVNPYRFGGQIGYRRDGANRTYVRARHLDTSRGRWISRDPIGLDSGDWNLYRYASNNPVNNIDPSGRFPFSCESCGEKIGRALWCTSQHACHHPYVHCLTCCLLAKRFGPHCARYDQWWQNWGGDRTARSRWCEVGVKGIYSKGMSCTTYCLQKSVFPFPPPPDCCKCKPKCDIQTYNSTVPFSCHQSFDCCSFLSKPTPAAEPAC